MADPSKYKYDYFKVSFPHEYVALVEINRPEKLHAFKEIMWLNLGAIFRKLSYDPDVRAVVLSSTGDRAFCAGLDVEAASQGQLNDTSSKDVARAANKMRRHILEFQESITAVERCEKPVIALLHGISYGLAIDLSLAADIRLCTTSTRMCVKEVDIGLAADIGTLTRLPYANVPLSWAKDVALTAREFGATEALSVGFISGVHADTHALVEAGLAKARAIAGKSPVAVVGTKEIMNYSREHGVEDGLKYSAVWNAGYTQTEDIKVALLAGVRKQKGAQRFEKL